MLTILNDSRAKLAHLSDRELHEAIQARVDGAETEYSLRCVMAENGWFDRLPLLPEFAGGTKLRGKGKR